MIKGIVISGIVDLIAQYRFRFSSEVQLHEGISKVLDVAGISYRREVRIDEHNRLDFLIDGGLVIEVKIAGSGAELLRQVHRYAQEEIVTGIIVVTNKPWHDLPPTLNGKPVAVHVMSRGGL